MFARIRAALSRPLTKIALGLTIILGLLAVATASLAVFRQRIAPPNELVHSAVQSRTSANVPAHVLVLRPTGFEPAEVSWPKERFFLAIENHSSVNDITVLLDREVGGRVKEVNLKMRKQRAAGMFDLPPGNYLLTVADHPGWVCRITITPR
ncbi:MAG TPA: hypothetical protein VGD61_15010 [Pyrinomonadaceae bacterium]